MTTNARTSMMFPFSTGNKYPFGQIWLKKKQQNCQFELKFGTYTNWNMQNSVVMLTLFLTGKNQNCQFKLKFGTSSN